MTTANHPLWNLAWIEANQPRWATVDGVRVLRVNESRFVAVPNSGRSNARKFDVLDLDSYEVVCQLGKNSVRGWLVHAHYHREVAP